MIRKALTTVMLALSLAALATLPANAVEIDLTEEVWLLDVLLDAMGYGPVEGDAGGYHIEVPAEEGDILEGEDPSGPVKDTGAAIGSL